MSRRLLSHERTPDPSPYIGTSQRKVRKSVRPSPADRDRTIDDADHCQPRFTDSTFVVPSPVV